MFTKKASSRKILHIFHLDKFLITAWRSVMWMISFNKRQLSSRRLSFSKFTLARLTQMHNVVPRTSLGRGVSFPLSHSLLTKLEMNKMKLCIQCKFVVYSVARQKFKLIRGRRINKCIGTGHSLWS